MEFQDSDTPVVIWDLMFGLRNCPSHYNIILKRVCKALLKLSESVSV